jgi:hypothetical protein
MTKPTDQEVHSALRTIIRNGESKALNYCVNYAKAGLYMYEEVLRIQCLYVLNNMTHWIGEEAKEVRALLKAYTK